MGADNQQERLDKSWLVGFVDGEGCFHVSINKQLKMTLGMQVLPEFRVRGMKNLNGIVKFFKENPLQTTKQKDFEFFVQIIDLMNNKEHLKIEGIKEIANLASLMNRQVKRSLESSETIRQTPRKK